LEYKTHTHTHTPLSLLLSLSIRYHWRPSHEPSLALWTFSPCTASPSTICSVHLQNTSAAADDPYQSWRFYCCSCIYWWTVVVVLLRFFLFFPPTRTRVSLVFIYLRFSEIYFWKNPKAESVWQPPPRTTLTSETKKYKTKHLAAKL